MGFQVHHYRTAFRFGNFGILDGYDSLRFRAGQLQQLAVSYQVGYSEAWRAGLFGSEEFTRTAHFEIEFRDRESVLSLDHGFQPALPFRRDFAAGHEHAVGFVRAAPNASAQLVKLRKPEAFSMLDHHHRGIGHIDSHFDNRGGDQNIDFAALEARHGDLFFVRAQATVEEPNTQIREDILTQLVVHFRGRFES